MCDPMHGVEKERGGVNTASMLAVRGDRGMPTDVSVCFCLLVLREVEQKITWLLLTEGAAVQLFLWTSSRKQSGRGHCVQRFVFVDRENSRCAH